MSSTLHNVKTKNTVQLIAKGIERMRNIPIHIHDEKVRYFFRVEIL